MRKMEIGFFLHYFVTAISLDSNDWGLRLNACSQERFTNAMAGKCSRSVFHHWTPPAIQMCSTVGHCLWNSASKSGSYRNPKFADICGSQWLWLCKCQHFMDRSNQMNLIFFLKLWTCEQQLRSSQASSKMDQTWDSGEYENIPFWNVISPDKNNIVLQNSEFPAILEFPIWIFIPPLSVLEYECSTGNSRVVTQYCPFKKMRGREFEENML